MATIYSLPAAAVGLIDAAIAHGGPFPKALETALPWLNANGLR